MEMISPFLVRRLKALLTAISEKAGNWVWSTTNEKAYFPCDWRLSTQAWMLISILMSIIRVSFCERYWISVLFANYLSCRQLHIRTCYNSLQFKLILVKNSHDNRKCLLRLSSRFLAGFWKILINLLLLWRFG